MNKKGQVAALASVGSSVAGSPIFQWTIGTIITGIALWYLYKTNPAFAAVLSFMFALFVFIAINVIFAYIWYYIGKWLYYIVVHAKAFVQNAVVWVLAVFE